MIRLYPSGGPMQPCANSGLPLTRRQMREMERAAEQAPASRATPSTVTAPRVTVRPRPAGISRAALLGSLGAATIAAPMTGFAPVSTPADAATLAFETPVTTLAAGAAATHLLQGTTPTATALHEDPLARLLASDQASRAQAQTVINGCGPTVSIGANGLLEAYTQRIDAIYRPMAEGTYTDTSGFGQRWGILHAGTDMAAPIGTPMYAVAGGTVVHAGEGIEGRSGSLVIIHSLIDGVDTWFWYGHMHSSTVYVSEGENVTAGQMIAGVGSEGRSTGPHLHFEIHSGQWENAVEPLSWLAGQSAIFPGQC
ncbi:MAG: M23 family metallopeptidase [bacterium]|nr:M23 family metallopeptidase [bacterium]